MPWTVRFGDEFEQEFLALHRRIQVELLAAAKVLADYGPELGRPYVDTLKGSKYANMKELRFDAVGRSLESRFCIRCSTTGYSVGGGR